MGGRVSGPGRVVCGQDPFRSPCTAVPRCGGPVVADPPRGHCGRSGRACRRRAHPPRSVLWLDDAHRFLDGTDGEGLAAALIARLAAGGPLLVMATIWSSAQALSAGPSHLFHPSSGRRVRVCVTLPPRRAGIGVHAGSARSWPPSSRTRSRNSSSRLDTGQGRHPLWMRRGLRFLAYAWGPGEGI
jgi:hypothetical protein